MTRAIRGAQATLADLLREHPAIAQVLVLDSEDGTESTAWIVPDRQRAAMLHRSAVIEDAGRLGALAWHEPADGFRVAGLNRDETEFLHREIFLDEAYLGSFADLPPNAVVVDVGANIGMFSLRAAMRSPGARVVAVEPVAELADAVHINAELHMANVSVLCAAVGSTLGETDFTFYPGNSVMSGRYASTTEDAAVLRGYLRTGQDPMDVADLDRVVAGRLRADRRRVPLITLARVAEMYHLDRIDLLKIDVEKAEMDVLDGIGDALWPSIDRVALEVHDIDGRLGVVIARLEHRGFVVRSGQDPRLALTPCHFVHAHRPGATGPDPAAPRPGTPVPTGPTLRELTRDLRRMISTRQPSAVAPDRFALVADLATVSSSPRPATWARGAAGTRRTAVLAEAWSDIFGPETARNEADFFDLGGTSLLALRLLDRVEEALGEGVLTVELIFATSTFGDLAAALEAGRVDY